MQIEKLDKKMREAISDLHLQNSALIFNEKETWQKLEATLLKQTKKRKYFMPIGWAAIFTIICLASFLVIQYSSNNREIQNANARVNEKKILIPIGNSSAKVIQTKVISEKNRFVDNKVEKNEDINLVISKKSREYPDNNIQSQIENKDTTFASLQNNIPKDVAIITPVTTTSAQKVVKNKLKIVHINELENKEELTIISKNEVKEVENVKAEVFISNPNINSSKTWLFFKNKNANTVTSPSQEN